MPSAFTSAREAHKVCHGSRMARQIVHCGSRGSCASGGHVQYGPFPHGWLLASRLRGSSFIYQNATVNLSFLDCF